MITLKKTTGEIIKELRIGKGYTQKQLADIISVSDRAVSKWERDYGCPDLSVICELCEALGTTVDYLLSGTTQGNPSGDFKATKLYVCEDCGNIVASAGDCSATCCGKKLKALELKLADDKHKLRLESFDADIIAVTDHEMSKEHYISLVAVISETAVLLYKQYPEWSINARIPATIHGMLVTVCNKHGAYVQKI